MPQIGPLEILVVAVLALLVLGPEKLPEMARSVGKGLKQLKHMASEVKSEFDLSLEEEPDPQPVIALSEVSPKEETSARPDSHDQAASA